MKHVSRRPSQTSCDSINAPGLRFFFCVHEPVSLAVFHDSALVVTDRCKFLEGACTQAIVWFLASSV